MKKLGLYRYGGGGYHCIWFDDEDIDIFAKTELIGCYKSGIQSEIGKRDLHL